MITFSKVTIFPHVMLGIPLFPRRGMEFILQTNNTVSYLYTRLHNYFIFVFWKKPKLFPGLYFLSFFFSTVPLSFIFSHLRKEGRKYLEKGDVSNEI